MAIKRKHIVVPNGSVEAICKQMNVHKSCVYNALNFTSNSEVAQKIRREALETFGGQMATKVIW